MRAPPGGRVHPDVWAAGAIAAFCVAAYLVTFTFDEVPAAIAQGMGAEAFPRLVLLVTAALTLFLAWRARRRDDSPHAPVPRMVWLTGATLLLFMAINELVGTLPASFLFLIGVGRLWGARRLAPLAASAFVFCLVVWAVFSRGFGLPLPGGSLAWLWW